MKRSVIAVVVAAGFALPAFAQNAAEVVCADYAAMDNAGKMAIVAELQSIVSESAASQELTNAEIEQTLAANCTDNPEMLVIEIIRGE